VYERDGEFLFEWGGFGPTPGKMIVPTGLDFDDQGYLYVVDRLNYRVQKFDLDGAFLGEFGSEISFVPDDTPIGIAIGSDYLYVVHPAANRIRRYQF